MENISLSFKNRKAIIRIKNVICENADELFESAMFLEVLKRYLEDLAKKDSPLIAVLYKQGVFESIKKHVGKVVSSNSGTPLEQTGITDKDIEALRKTIQFLAKMDSEHVVKIEPRAADFISKRGKFNEFIEQMYNFWRSYERFIICTSEGDEQDKKPYRTFNRTVEKLTHLIRGSYRDIQENITGTARRIYRQVAAGAEVAAISLPKDIPFPTEAYDKLRDVPVIRQVLMYPPLVLNPPMNKRTGSFEKIDIDPIKLISIDPEEWLCYPAKIGKLTILIYFREKFFGLGFSLCNLFEIAGDEDLKKKPDGVYFYGVDEESLSGLNVFPTVFYDGIENDMLVAAIPAKDEFGYFGYLKKMALTLHNIAMMKKGLMPFHGSMFELTLRGGKKATILLMGETATGKSETIEAIRSDESGIISRIRIIADDMGSMEITDNGELKCYGTEIGAFLRLDDMPAGYAFGQIDRSIILSAGEVNARVIIPVSDYDDIIRGDKPDFVLYANNYDDPEKLTINKFDSAKDALEVFRSGAAMSKGTTTSSGITNTYFANIFGPLQYKELHEVISEKFFNKFFEKDIFVGQIYTRLGIKGLETDGPAKCASEIIKMISDKKD